MEFKIEQIYPSPNQPNLSFSTLTYAHNIQSLILYGQQKNTSQPALEAQPKKKIAFKSNKSATAPSVDKISIFDLQQQKWIIKQANGKIPSPRTNFKTIYMGSCLLLYGGKVNQKYSNQVYALNTQKWVWKKLFSLQGPPADQNSIFCKLTQNSACLITKQTIWVLHIGDVKWQLQSNDLPGSIWEKLPVQLPKNPLLSWVLNDSFVCIVGTQQTYVIDFIKKQKIQTLSFNSCEKLNIQQDVNSSEIRYLNFQISQLRINSRVVVSIKNKIMALNLSQNNDQRKIDMYSVNSQPYLVAPQSQIVCMTLVKNQVIFLIDNTGQLLSTQFIQQQSLVQQEEPSTTRILQSPNKSQTKISSMRNNDMSNISEQQNESSFIVHNDSEVISKKQENNSVLKQSRESSKIHEKVNQNRYEYSDKQFDSQKQIIIKSSQENIINSESQQTLEVKQKLSSILVHQHLKRRLLEQKIKTLEQMIKKSEKFVLLLCKYGNKSAKRAHIQKVKQLRQQLQYNLSKQLYYRRQMGSSQLPNQVSNQVDRTITKINL